MLITLYMSKLARALIRPEWLIQHGRLLIFAHNNREN